MDIIINFYRNLLIYVEYCIRLNGLLINTVDILFERDRILTITFLNIKLIFGG